MQRTDRSIRRATPRWARVVALGAVTALALSACGGDDDDDDASADSAEFCDAYVAANNATSADEPPADLEDILTTAEDTAPDDISGAVTTMTDYARNSGDSEDLPPPEFFDANVEVGEYVEANCGFDQIDVTAKNYEFSGIPDDVSAGTLFVKFTNEGDEFHELVMVGIPEDETRSLEELIALGEEAEELITPVDGFAFAAPGGTFYTTYDLAAGKTGAVCFIPVGMTPEALEAGPPPDAEPHAAHGMFQEFTVS